MCTHRQRTRLWSTCYINPFRSKKYDAHFVSASSRSTRKSHDTELKGSDFGLDSPSEVAECLDYDKDASAATLFANMTNSGNYNP